MVDKYLLRNTTRRDINLGDLRYKIPAGQVRNLLSRTARIDRKRLEDSAIRGSIAVRLKNGDLEEVVTCPDLRPPRRIDISQEPVRFPRQTKTSIVLDVAEMDEQMSNIMLNEEDELLKEMAMDDMMESDRTAPIIAKQPKDTEENEEGAETEEDV